MQVSLKLLQVLNKLDKHSFRINIKKAIKILIIFLKTFFTIWQLFQRQVHPYPVKEQKIDGHSLA